MLIGSGGTAPQSIFEKWNELFARNRSAQQHDVHSSYSGVGSGMGLCNLMRKCLEDRPVVFSAGEQLPSESNWEEFDDIRAIPVFAM